MIIKAIVYICYFLSGFAALIHELSWSRILKQVFISETITTAMVLVIFFGGIAVGAYLAAALSKFLHPNKSSYASLFIFSLFNLLLAFLTYLTASFFSPNHLLSSLSLAPISVLLGTLFPLLSNFYVAYRESSTQTKTNSVAKAYFINTFAGLFGIFFVIFFAFKTLGLTLTLHKLALIHLAIFILSLVPSLFNMKEIVLEFFESLKIFSLNLSLHGPKNELSKIYDDNDDSESVNIDKSQGYKALLWVSFAFGFILLGLELVWQRAFSLILASSVYSFSMILAAVIFGLAFGSFTFYLLAKPLNLSLKDSFEKDLENINWLILLLAALIFISSYAFKSLTPTYLSLVDSVNFLLTEFQREDLYRLSLTIIKFILAAMIIVPVTATISYTGTYLLQIFTYSDSLNDRSRLTYAGANIGKLFFVNTLGGILGALFTVFFFIPSLEGGLNQCFLIFNLIALLTLVINLSFFKEKQYFLFLISALCFIALFLLKPNFISARTASGAELYYALKYRGDYALSLDSSAEEVLYHADGLYSTVTVIKDPLANTIYLKNNAKVEAGIPIEEDIFSAADMQTQVLLGVSAKYFKEDFKNVLLVGMGSGITLDSLAMIAPKAKIQVAEIEELIFKVADKYFAKAWKLIPERNVERYIGNARSLLKNSKEKYDLIVSQPSDPWLSTDMFTDEFWKLAHRKLSKDGIFVQWLQLYSLEPKYLLLTLNTLKHNFKNLVIIHPTRTAELIILASDKDFRFRDFNLNEYPYLKSTLNHVSIHNSADFLGNVILTPKDVNLLLKNEFPRLDFKTKFTRLFNPRASISVNNSDNSLLEFHTAQNFYKFSQTITDNLKALNDYVNFENIISLVNYNSEAERSSLIQALRANYQKSISGQSLRLRNSFYKNKLYVQSLSDINVPLVQEEEIQEALIVQRPSLDTSSILLAVDAEGKLLDKAAENESSLAEDANVDEEKASSEEPFKVKQPLNISAIDENNYRSLLSSGVYNFNQGSYLAAEKDFKAALKIDPNLDQAYLYLAQIKLLMKDDSKFMEYINYCLRINPYNVKALYLAADYDYQYASLSRAFAYTERILNDTDYRAKLNAGEIANLVKIRKKLQALRP